MIVNYKIVFLRISHIISIFFFSTISELIVLKLSIYIFCANLTWVVYWHYWTINTKTLVNYLLPKQLIKILFLACLCPIFLISSSCRILCCLNWHILIWNYYGYRYFYPNLALLWFRIKINVFINSEFMYEIFLLTNIIL